MRVRLAAAVLLCLAAFASTAQALDLNSFRAAHGRKALRADASLAAMAQAHAADLARRGRLDHAGFSGPGGRGRAGAAAENVSYGCNDESCAILQWSRSAPHRANMLRANLATYGLASATASDGRRYWVMELGSDVADAGGALQAAAKKPPRGAKLQAASRAAQGIEIREWLEDIR